MMSSPRSDVDIVVVKLVIFFCWRESANRTWSVVPSGKLHAIPVWTCLVVDGRRVSLWVLRTWKPSDDDDLGMKPVLVTRLTRIS